MQFKDQESTLLSFLGVSSWQRILSKDSVPLSVDRTQTGVRSSLPVAAAVVKPSLQHLIYWMGGDFSAFWGGAVPPSKLVLVPPRFDRDVYGRARFCESAYDHLFFKSAMQRIMADLIDQHGMHATLLFSPPADKRVSVEANIEGLKSGLKCLSACMRNQGRIQQTRHA